MNKARNFLAWRLHAIADWFVIEQRWMGKLRWKISIFIDRIAMMLHC